MGESSGSLSSGASSLGEGSANHRDVLKSFILGESATVTTLIGIIEWTAQDLTQVDVIRQEILTLLIPLAPQNETLLLVVTVARTPWLDGIPVAIWVLWELYRHYKQSASMGL